MKLIPAVLGAIGSLWFAAEAASSDVMHRWVQLGPGSETIVRVITRAPACPVLQVDGRAVPMTQRAAATARYPGLVCERRLPRSSRQVAIDDRPLPMVKPEVRRIAVIGDTGCRIKWGRAQACNDPDAWPLDAILAAIVEQKPDLVIHVGDYLYREAPCPPSADCQGSPHGHNAPTWAADWFGPARQLLSQTPFLFLRGNHEQCGRAAMGWFRYLAVGPVPGACVAVSAPWKTRVAGVGMIAFDSSDGPAPRSAVRHLAEYRRMANAMFAGADGESWLLTHRPLWVYLDAFGELITGDSTQRAAFGAAIPKSVSLILSGHIHAFQALDLATGPVQLVVGNSGTRLDPMPNEVKRNVDVAGSLARTITGDAGFGFAMLQRMEEGRWRVEALDVRGTVRHRCRMSGRNLSCEDRR